MPEALQSPLQRRSQYLAEALKASRQPQNIQGWGELAARLLAQGITQTAANRTDEALSNEALNADLTRRQQLAARVGGSVEGEKREVGTGRYDPIASVVDAIRGKPAQPEVMPQAAPQAPVQAAPMPTNTQEPISSPVAPMAQVEGAPLPQGGQPMAMPQAQAPAPAMAAPQPAPNPLGPTEQERALIMQYLNSGDEGMIAAAEKMVQDIELRQAQPAWQRREYQQQNGVGGGYDPATNSWTVIAGGVPQEAMNRTLVAEENNTFGLRPGTVYTVSPQGKIDVVDEPTEGMIRQNGRTMNEPGYVEAEAERQRVRQGIETEGQREQDRPQFEARLGRIEQTTSTIREEVAYAQRLIAENPGIVGLIGSAQARIPGTPAFDLAQSLETIQANIGFEYLQDMRNSNPTGGGVGALSDSERTALGSTSGSLSQGSSADRLNMSLSRIDRLTQSGYQRARAMYDATYNRPAPQPEQDRPQQRQNPPNQPRPAPRQQPQSNGQRRRYNPATGRIE